MFVFPVVSFSILYCLGLKKDAKDCCLGPVAEDPLVDFLSMVVVLVDFFRAGVGTAAAGVAGLLATGDGAADCWDEEAGAAVTGVADGFTGVSSSSSSRRTLRATTVLTGCPACSDGWGVEAVAPPKVPITVLPPQVGVALRGAGVTEDDDGCC